MKNSFSSSNFCYHLRNGSWKPVADWPCEAVGSRSILGFDKKERLFQLMDVEINSLDVAALKGLRD
jgi:hypothetical protein